MIAQDNTQQITNQPLRQRERLRSILKWKCLYNMPWGYSVPCQKSKMERFAKIVDDFQPLSILEKHSTFDDRQGSDYVSRKLSCTWCKVTVYWWEPQCQTFQTVFVIVVYVRIYLFPLLKLRMFKIWRIDISIFHCVIYSQLLLLCFSEVVSMNAFLTIKLTHFAANV